MPFLRVIRDRRGYETTYLLHWYRDGFRQRSRILYVFRTPGGVRVGRDALDTDVLRQLESQYPDIEFDWTAMREHRQVIETAPEPRRRRPRLEEAVEDVAQAEPILQEPGPAPAAAAPAAPSPVPAAIEGSTPEEQIAFLRTWHPLVLERIPRRVADPARQEALQALAARLDPNAWTEGAGVEAALLQAAHALERLSRILTRRRRRTRRRSPDAPAVASVLAGEPSPEAADGSDDPPDQSEPRDGST